MPAMMVSLQNTNHSSHILSVLKSDRQVEVLPGAGDPVTLGCQALSALSPFFRGILSSVPCCVEPLIILPEATEYAVHQFVTFTKGGATDILNNVGEVQEVKEVTQMFQINSSNYFVESKSFEPVKVKSEQQEILINPLSERHDTNKKDEETVEQFSHDKSVNEEDIDSTHRENLALVLVKNEASDIDHLSCQSCGKLFKAKRYLRDHTLLKHSNDTAFIEKAKLISKRKSLKHKCEICHQLLNSRNIMKHIRNNHPEIDTRIPCFYCDKLFTTRQVQKRHMEDMHMNTRRFECVTCKLSFKRRDHLEGHVKIHTSEKRHSCDKCGYASFRERDLVKHMCRLKTHSCELCGEKSVSRKGLQKHKKRSHSV